LYRSPSGNEQLRDSSQGMGFPRFVDFEISTDAPQIRALTIANANG
jgi:hypothetical protein